MGLMYVFVGLFVLGVILDLIYTYTRFDNNGIIITGASMIVLAGFAIFISVIVIVVNSIGAKGTVISFQERREKIVSNIETGLYTDKLDIRDVDIINSIEDLNREIKVRQAYQRDPWVGVFIPDIYDQFVPIPYEGLRSTSP